MSHAADELALAAASVITRLEMRGEQFPVLLAGGMLKESAWLAVGGPPSNGRGRAARDGRAATQEPAVGAVRLAIAEARGGVRVPPYIELLALDTAVNIERFADEDALSSALAARVLESIVAKPSLVLGLPTGRTPLGLYRELRERSGGDRIDWSRVRTFNLDEFAGIGRRQSEQLSRVHAGGVVRSRLDRSGEHRFPRRRGGRSGAECRRYDEAIAAAGGIDLQILGIGANGHIGFNEPADGLCAPTHIARARTREQGSERRNDLAATGRRVPERALSMGMATILNARADCADCDRRGEGRRRSRHDRRPDHDAAAGVDSAGAPARDGDARSRRRADSL